MTPEQEERLVTALEGISTALARIAHLQLTEFEIRHEPKPKPSPATITRIKTAEERLREDLGGDGTESLEEWVTLEELGPRELEYLRREEAARKAADSSGETSAGSEHTEEPQGTAAHE